MPIVTKNAAELENKIIDSYQNIAVVNDLDTMLIINDGSLYSIGAQVFMTYIKDHPDLATHYASKKELIEELNLKLDKAEKGIASGVTPLNENKKVPAEHILFGKTSGTTYQGSDGKTLEDDLNAHKSNFNNPHKVTAQAIHLENVDNTSDMDKPVSIPVQNAITAACSNSNQYSDTSISEHNLSETAHAAKFNQKLDNKNASTFLKNVSYNSDTGVFVFTKYDNTTITIDTPIEEVVTGGVTRTLLSTELQNSLTTLESNVHNHNNKLALDEITSANIIRWNNKSDFDGNYLSLAGLPKVPTKTSDLSNDSDFSTNSSVSIVKNAVSKLEKYVPFHNLSSDNQTQFIKDLGFTLDNTIFELWNMLPDVAVIPNILNNSNQSKFNSSLPVYTGGIVSIIKAGGRGYLEFVDFRTNKKYIKAIVDGIWSDWSEIATTNIIGNTNISNIGNGTLTGGLSKINSDVIQCFQSVSNGKTLIASAITDKGISTTSDATFQIMANNINKIQTGGGGKRLTFSASGWVDINRNNLGVNITTNVNCTSVAGWQNLSNTNFTVGLTAATGGVVNNSDHKSGVSISSHSYNKSNGILTITLRAYTERYDFSSNVGLTYGCNGFVYVN